VLAEEVSDITHVWPAQSSKKGHAATEAASGRVRPKKGRHADARTDWVTFLLGCSFSFEDALLQSGLPVRHLQEERQADAGAPKSPARAAPPPVNHAAKQPRNVPMYVTTQQCAPGGVFSGPLVVSMRPMTPAQAAVADRVTAAFPRVHGRPVHAGTPASLGISDLASPDYGDAVTVYASEVPVFWACGVTPQAALLRARLPIAITHAPGHMFVTDVSNASLAGVPELPRLPGSVLPQEGAM
jgi:uncharacterized protein YcsI (UPF0317 family)